MSEGTDMVTGQYCWSLQPGSTLLLQLSTPSTAAMLARWDLFWRQTLPRAHRNPVMLAHSFRQSCHMQDSSYHYEPIPLRPQSMTATRYTMRVTAMKTWKTNGILLKNHQIHDIVGQISPSLWSSWFVAVMVCGHHGCGRHGLWPSWFVAVMVCGHHGLWPSWLWPSWFVAIMVVAIMVCGRHGLWPSWYRHHPYVQKCILQHC